MLPVITFWHAKQDTDYVYEQSEDKSYTKYLHTAPIILTDNQGHYRSIIVKMKVRNFKVADTICRYFPRIRDALYFQSQDHPELLNQKVGIIDLHTIDIEKTIENIIGKGRARDITLLDKEVMGSKATLRSNYKCYGKYAEIM